MDLSAYPFCASAGSQLTPIHPACSPDKQPPSTGAALRQCSVSCRSVGDPKLSRRMRVGSRHSFTRRWWRRSARRTPQWDSGHIWRGRIPRRLYSFLLAPSCFLPDPARSPRQRRPVPEPRRIDQRGSECGSAMDHHPAIVKRRHCPSGGLSLAKSTGEDPERPSAPSTRRLALVARSRLVALPRRHAIPYCPELVRHAWALPILVISARR